jgi:hypothetical protein
MLFEFEPEPRKITPFEDFNNLNSHLPVPIIYDEANEHRVLTKRLMIKMKKAMRLLGDVPKHIAIDGSQYLDLEDREDCPEYVIEEDLGLEYDLIDRPRGYDGDTCPDPCGRNRFCVMTGEAGKVVIGAYPAAIEKGTENEDRQEDAK